MGQSRIVGPAAASWRGRNLHAGSGPEQSSRGRAGRPTTGLWSRGTTGIGTAARCRRHVPGNAAAHSGYRVARQSRPLNRRRHRTPVLYSRDEHRTTKSLSGETGEGEKKTGQLAELLNVVLVGRRLVERRRAGSQVSASQVGSLRQARHLHAALRRHGG